MDDGQILDNDPLIKKRFDGNWMGAKLFAYGVTILVMVLVVTPLLEDKVSDAFEAPSSIWSTIMYFAVIAFFFLNVVGGIVSVSTLVSAKTKSERFAGIVSLLLNLSPYIIIGGLYALIILVYSSGQ